MSEALDRARKRHGITPTTTELTEEQRLERAAQFLREQRVDPARERARKKHGVVSEPK